MASAEDIYGSPYLRASDVGESEVRAIIVEIGPEQFSKQGQSTRPKLVIRVDKFRKPIVLNKTNAKRLIKAWGDDWEQWVGNTLLISVHDVEYQGNTVEGLLLVPLQLPPSAGAGPESAT